MRQSGSGRVGVWGRGASAGGKAGRTGRVLAASVRPVVEALEERRLLSITATYFDNGDLTGANFRQIDNNVYFTGNATSWGSLAPDPRLNADSFSVRWQGQVLTPNNNVTEDYRFGVRSDDGCRLWVNGQLIIDNYVVQSQQWRYGTAVQLAPNTRYDIKLEYFDSSGGANVQLNWSSNHITDAIIPAANLFADAQTTAPGVPSGLTANAASPTAVTLTWAAGSGTPSSYKIERSADNGATFTEVALTDPAATGTSYTDLGLAPGTAYTYRVRAYNSAGNSAYTATASASTSASTLPTPWTQRDVNLVGADGSSAYAAATGTFTLAGAGVGIDQTADSFRYAYRTLTGDGQIVARVTGQQNTGAAGARAGVMFRDALTPGSPGAFMALSPTGGAVFATRSAAGGSAATTTVAGVAAPYWLKLVRAGSVFTAYRSADGTTWTQVGAATTLTGMASGSTAYVGLAVTGGSYGTLGTAAFDAVTVTATPPTIPTAPSGVAATPASTTQINLVWADNSDNEQGFKIERKAGAGGTYAQIATVTAGVTAYQDTGLTAGTTYSYRVRAYNAAGDSAYAAEVSATIVASGDGLSATYYDNIDFTGDAVTRTDASLDFLWPDGQSPAPGIAANTFTAEWSGRILAPSTGTYTFEALSDDGVRVWIDNRLVLNDWDVHSPSTASGTIDLVGGTKYDVRVEYFQNYGSAELHLNWVVPGAPTGTNAVAIPTANLYSQAPVQPPAQPDAPGSVVAAAPAALDAADQPRVELTWDDVAGADVYLVYRSGDGGTTWAAAGSALAGVHAFADDDPTLDTAAHYRYRVLAAGAGGRSAFADALDGPANLRVAVTSDGTTNLLTWDPAVDATGEWEVDRSLDAGASWQWRGEIPGDGTSFTDVRDGGAGVTYLYRVRAISTMVASDYAVAAESSATVAAVPLSAEYFPNTTLSGSPVADQLDYVGKPFSWNTAAVPTGGSPGSPLPAGIPSAGFSVRITGRVTAPVDGDYTFQTVADGGVRLFVGGQKLFENWNDVPNQPGDANRDGTVDFDDLLALAKNYNGTGKTWRDGDFSGGGLSGDDPDGTVNFDDLLALAKHYNGQQAPRVDPAVPADGVIHLTGGQTYTLVLEYFNANAFASAELQWTRPPMAGESGPVTEDIPQSQLLAPQGSPPVVTLSGSDQSIQEGGSVNFTLGATGGSDPITGWLVHTGERDLTFDGTSPPTGVTFQHQGSYTVTAEAVGQSGAQYAASGSFAVTVSDAPFTVAAVVDRVNVNKGQPVSLHASVDDPGVLDSLTFHWAIARNGVTVASPQGIDVEFTPDAGGDYTATVTASDGEGVQATSPAVTFHVFATAPSVSITGPSSAQGGVPYTLSLARTESPGNLDFGWSIDWGDGAQEPLGGDVTSATHTFPVDPADHDYQISAFVQDTDGTHSASPVTVHVPKVEVAAPGGLAATVSSTAPFTSIDLTWPAVTGATGYVIERVGLVAEGFLRTTDLTVPGGSTTTYHDTGLLSDTEYAYTIRALRGDVESTDAAPSGLPAKARTKLAPVALAAAFDVLNYNHAYEIPASAGLLKQAAPTLRVGWCSQPEHGQITFNPDGSFSYTAEAGYTGVDSFQYKTYDTGAGAQFLSLPARVSLVVGDFAMYVKSVSSESLTVPSSAFYVGTLSDSSVSSIYPYADTSALEYRILGTQNAGIAEVTDPTTGAFTYRPANYTSVYFDRLYFQVWAKGTAAAPATPVSNIASFDFKIFHDDQPDPSQYPSEPFEDPAAYDDTVSVSQDDTLSVSKDDSVFNEAVDPREGESGDDTDDADEHMILLPAVDGGDTHHGTLTVADDGSYTYVPDPGFEGYDWYTYQEKDSDTASGGGHLSNYATVLIKVNPPVLTIDADNDDAYSRLDGDVVPVTGSSAEAMQQNSTGDAEHPGKVIQVNSGDEDADGVPDYADGMDWDQSGDGGDPPTPGTALKPGQRDNSTLPPAFAFLHVNLPSDFKWDTGKVRFLYDASDPTPSGGMTRTGSGTSGDPWEYTPADGHLRLWTYFVPHPSQDRDALSVEDQPADSTRGAFVPSEAWFSGDTLNQLAVKPNASWDFLVEAVRPSDGVADQTVQVEIDPDGTGLHVHRGIVRTTLTNFDVDWGPDGDDDTVAGSTGPAEDSTVEQREGFVPPTAPQNDHHVIAVDDADLDGDGVPDFAEGYDGAPAGDPAAPPPVHFTKLLVHLPSWSDPTQALFQVHYDASDPAGVIAVGDAPNVGYRPANSADVDANLPGPASIGHEGALRVWTADGAAPRSAASVTDAGGPGNYVPPDTIVSGEQLGLTAGDHVVALYVEAVRASQFTGDQAIWVEVSPLGDQANFVLSDTVHLTAVQPTPTNTGSPSASPGGVASGATGGDPGAAEFSPSGVRYFDGSANVAGADLSTAGLGTPWGQTRTWSSDFGFAQLDTVGNGWAVAQLPAVQRSDGTMIVAGGDGGTALYFDAQGTVGGTGANQTYRARFVSGVSLTHDTANHEFVLVDSTGNQTVFYDFDVDTNPVQWGHFKRFLSPSGTPVATAAYDQDTGKLKTVDRVPDSGPKETFSFGYVDSGDNQGLLDTVELQRAGLTIRKAQYDYYGPDDDHGGVGDLKTVTITDPNGSGDGVVGKYYYRYKKFSYHRLMPYYFDSTDGGYDTDDQERRHLEDERLIPWAITEEPSHLLQYVLNPESYKRMQQALGGADPANAADDQLERYATYSYEYDPDTGRVTTAKVQGAGASGSGSTDARGTYGYTYAENPIGADGANVWKYKTTETLPDDGKRTVYTNFAGEVMLEVLQDGVTGEQYLTFNHYDEHGRVDFTAEPSAVTGYDERLPDLLGAQGGSTPNYQYVADNSGLVERTSYYPDTGGGTGAAPGFVHETRVSHGEADPGTLLSRATYLGHDGAAGAKVYVVSGQSVFRNGDGTGEIKTTYDYANWVGLQPGKVTTHLPKVSQAQNGANTDDTVTQLFDEYGRVTDTTDADGYTRSAQYDDPSGGITQEVVEVGNGAPDDLVTAHDVDPFGRVTQTKDPNGNVTDYTFNDVAHERRVYPALGPVQVTREDWAHGYVDTLTYSPTTRPTNPDGSDPIVNLQSLTRTFLDEGGRAVEVRTYCNLANLPYSTNPDMGTAWATNGSGNYYKTTYSYDAGGHRNQTTNGAGTVTETAFDTLGRVHTVKVGGTVVEEYVYNGPDRDGTLAKVVEHPTGARSVQDRATAFSYDWRDRQVATKDGATDDPAGEDATVNRPLTYCVLDNLGQCVRQLTYDGDGVTLSNVGGVPAQPAGALARGKTVTLYDDRGRAYRTETFSVDPYSGLTAPDDDSSPALTQNVFYDGRDHAIETDEPGGIVEKTQYDGAGRPFSTQTYGGSILWSQTDVTYDDDGNPVLTTKTDQGPAGSRTSYFVNYYDAANRLTDEVDVGTNGGVAPALGTDLDTLLGGYGSGPFDGADPYLHTHYEYDQAGYVKDTTDPRGVLTRTLHDALGRTYQRVDAYSAADNGGNPTLQHNRVTNFTFTPLDQVKTVSVLSAKSSGVDTNTTTYNYGVDQSGGSAIQSNDLLAGIVYGPSANADVESFTYDALGEVTRKTDRTRAVHTITYDLMGRVTADAIGDVQPGMSSASTARTYDYDTLGRVTLGTTYGGVNGNWGVTTQVERDYDGLGNVVTEWQAHGGPVTASTPKVVYGYDTSNNHSRLSSVTYPNGRAVGYSYDAGGSVTSVNDGGPSGPHLEEYTYLGVGTVVERKRPLAGGGDIDLKYFTPGFKSPDSGDAYTAFDRFGRVVEQWWVNHPMGGGFTTLDDYKYGYDADSHLLYQQNLTDPDYSALFQANGATANSAYDAFGRMTDFRQGVLGKTQPPNGRPNLISAGTSSKLIQLWSVQNDGNFQRFVPNKYQNPPPNTPVDDPSARTIYQGKVPDDTTEWSKDSGFPAEHALLVAFDPWGELTTQVPESERQLEQQVPFSENFKWGFRPDQPLTTYTYDAFGRRVTDGSTDLYLDLSGDVIQEGVGPMPSAQYVWGADGQLILRDRGSERLFALADGQGNISAIANTSGGAVEHYLYSPEGKLTVKSGDWGDVKNNASAYDWRYTFRSGRRDGVGLYYLGNQEWDYLTGGPLAQDPRAYENARQQVDVWTIRRAMEAQEAERESHAWVSAPTGWQTWIPGWSSVKGFLHDVSVLPYDLKHGNGVGGLAGVFGNGIFVGFDAFGVGSLIKGGVGALARAGAANVERSISRAGAADVEGMLRTGVSSELSRMLESAPKGTSVLEGKWLPQDGRFDCAPASFANRLLLEEVHERYAEHVWRTAKQKLGVTETEGARLQDIDVVFNGLLPWVEQQEGRELRIVAERAGDLPEGKPIKLDELISRAGGEPFLAQLVDSYVYDNGGNVIRTNLHTLLVESIEERIANVVDPINGPRKLSLESLEGRFAGEGTIFRRR